MAGVQARDGVRWPGRKLDHFDGKRFSLSAGLTANVATSNQDGQPIVQLWGVNSRGDLSRHYLSVPLEKLDEVIAHLQGVRDAVGA